MCRSSTGEITPPKYRLMLDLSVDGMCAPREYWTLVDSLKPELGAGMLQSRVRCRYLHGISR
jgi:hypothetical protein